jgi:hypothetical protein
VGAATAAEAIDGNTTRNIAEAPHIAIGRRRTGLGELRAAIRSPTARPAPGNRLAGKVAICPATEPEEVASVIGPTAQALATGRAEAARTASEAGIFHAAVAGIGMRSEEVRAGTTDRALAPAAAAAPPAWDLEAEAAVASVVVAAVEGGAGSTPRLSKGSHRSTE